MYKLQNLCCVEKQLKPENKVEMFVVVNEHKKANKTRTIHQLTRKKISFDTNFLQHTPIYSEETINSSIRPVYNSSGTNNLESHKNIIHQQTSKFQTISERSKYPSRIKKLSLTTSQGDFQKELQTPINRLGNLLFDFQEKSQMINKNATQKASHNQAPKRNALNRLYTKQKFKINAIINKEIEMIN